VLFMDLDGFKRINDTLGHNAGDYLLQSVAARLKDGLRDSDIVARAVSDQSNEIFARLGGDEFTVIVPYIRDMEAVGALADRIRSLVGHPFIIQGREIVVTASIGIAVYPEDGGDAATLLKHADTAMYQAKDEGRNNWKTYSTALTTRAMHRLEMENSLRRGLERQEFCLYYQPQMRAADGRIDSVEALVRWNHPERGLVPPNEFIPIAEEGALIIPLGEWVLREALAQVRAWHKMGHSNLRVAVNLSGRQLRDANFVASVLQNLRATAFDGRFLELELTETILMDSTESTIGRLKQLSEAGVHFSIDDFGTGYSSMGYLKRFPIQLLKIDRSFVQGLPHNPDDVAIATAIISMAHSLHLEVVAEGVETPEQAEFLRRAGCEKLQGYLFSRPQPAAQIPALLAHGLTEATA
jgi:diguanylate cyclase (GGDEF)-like protein